MSSRQTREVAGPLLAGGLPVAQLVTDSGDRMTTNPTAAVRAAHPEEAS